MAALGEAEDKEHVEEEGGSRPVLWYGGGATPRGMEVCWGVTPACSTSQGCLGRQKNLRW